MGIHSTNKACVAFAVSLFLAYLLPYHVSPYPSFYNDWLAGMGCVLAIAYFAGKETVIAAPSIALVPVGLTMVVLIQTCAGMMAAPWDSVLSIGYLLMAALAVIFGASCTIIEGGAWKLCRGLAYAYLCAGLVSVVIAFCQFIGAEIHFTPYMMAMLHREGNIIRPTGNIAQSNHLALLFCLGLGSLWWLFQASRLRGSLAFMMAILLIFGLSLTQSRIGWIIVPLLALSGWLWSRRERSVSGTSVLILVAIYAALIFCLPGIASLLGVEASFALDRSNALSSRVILFRQAWEMSLAHPWLGVGWYQFGPEQVRIASAFPPSVYSGHAHNIVLNFAAELGWPITIAVFGVLLYWLSQAIRGVKSNRETAFAFLCFIAVTVHSMVEYPLWYGYVLFPICLLIGMVHQQRFGSKQLTCPGTALLLFALLASFAFAGVAMDYRRVVVGYWWNKWEALAMSMGADKVEKPEITIFPHFFDYLQLQKITVRPGMSPEELTDMEKIVQRFGFGTSLLRLSLAYGLNGREDDAVKAALTIRSLSPLYYGEAHGAWKRTADDHPEYLPLLKRLPLPQ